MKKKWLISTLAMGLLLTGCSKDPAKETASNVQKNTQQSQPTEEDIARKNSEIKIENVENKSYSYEDKEMGEKKVNYSAVIENKSKENVDVSEISITYLNKKGSVIGSSVDSTVWVSPSVLKPGQKAYVSNETDINTADELDKAELTVSPEITDEKAKEIPVSGAIVDVNEDNTFIFLRGQVKNTTKTPSDNVTVGAAIYDKDNNLITTVYGQVQDTVNPGQKVPFEADSPYMNFNKLTEPDHYEYFAYTYEYPEGTAGEGGDGEVTE